MVYVIGNPVWVARRRMWALARLGLFTTTAMLGGAGLAYTLGLVPNLPPIGAASLVATSAGLLWLARAKLGMTLPQIKAQVPVQIKSRPWAAPVLYGLLLGAAVFTYVPSAWFYVYCISLLAVASPFQGLIAGSVFGLAYSATVVVAARPTCTKEPLAQANAVLSWLARKHVHVTIAGVAVVAALLVGLSVRYVGSL
jgi:hypothetical protein